MEIAGANRHRGFLVTRLGQANAPASFCLLETNGSSDELLGFDGSIGLIKSCFPFRDTMYMYEKNPNWKIGEAEHLPLDSANLMMQRKNSMQNPHCPKRDRLGRNPHTSCPCCHLPFSVNMTGAGRATLLCTSCVAGGIVEGLKHAGSSANNVRSDDGRMWD